MAVRPPNETAGRLSDRRRRIARSALLQLGSGAAVLRPGLLVGAGRIGILLAEAGGPDARRRNALGDEVLAGRIGAPLAERQVVFARPALVAVAGDGDGVVRVLLQPFGLTIERLASVFAQARTVEIEEHAIADILLEVGDGSGRDGRRRCRCGLLLAAAGGHEDHRCNGQQGLDHTHFSALREGWKDHIGHYWGIKGDQAGSDASVAVGTGLSNRPVMSICASEAPPPRFSRKNISTRPLGAHVGPSTRKPLASMRSPPPSGRITPMPKLPPVILVKAIRSPRGDHTGVAYLPSPKLMRRSPPPPAPMT